MTREHLFNEYDFSVEVWGRLLAYQEILKVLIDQHPNKVHLLDKLNQLADRPPAEIDFRGAESYQSHQKDIFLSRAGALHEQAE